MQVFKFMKNVKLSWAWLVLAFVMMMTQGCSESDSEQLSSKKSSEVAITVETTTESQPESAPATPLDSNSTVKEVAEKITAEEVVDPDMPAESIEKRDGYEVLKHPQSVPDDGKQYVEHFFLYTCPHCSDLEPKIKEWMKSLPKDVEFRYVPAMLGKAWARYGSYYYAMENFGILEKGHPAMFKAIHEDRLFMQTFKDLIPFFAQFNISEDKVTAMFNSETTPESVKLRMKSAIIRVAGYRLNTVPIFIVNGKYKVSAQTAGSDEEAFAVIELLLEQERDQNTKK